MECWCVSKIKSWLLIWMTILVLMVCRIEGGCIEEERKALLEIKTSLIDSYFLDLDQFLPSWVDDGSIGGKCCDWERVTCNTTTGHVTNLSLRNMVGIPEKFYGGCKSIWPLNVSVFLNFKELTSLNLSWNCLDNNIVNTGLRRLSSLKKLKTLDLSLNSIGNEIFHSLGALTSLRVLNLGFEQVSLLKKLKILNLQWNNFNESLITSLSALPILKSLDFSYNWLGLSFPVEELAQLTNLEELDLSHTYLSGTPSIQECTRLSRLKKLKSISLQWNDFNKSIISCLSTLPSLKTLDLSHGTLSGELLHLSDLEVLLLKNNDFNGTLPMEAFTSFHHLKVLDLSANEFVGSIASTINALSPSIRVVSFAYNKLNGSILGLCELKNLWELDLSHNMFEGNLPHCFNSLSSLKLLDISSNQFTGTLPPSLIANLTSLEYVDFSDNKFEGAFSFSSFSSHKKLEVVIFKCNNDKFEMETEEPMGWIPMFQLKALVLSGCNLNRPKASVVPGFLLQQRMLRMIDLSHNSLRGQFPNRLIENNTMLEALILRNNSFGGTISMPLHTHANLIWLDMSENQILRTIPGDIHKFFPYLAYLNLSRNILDGSISSIADLGWLNALDLSDNEFSGEVPNRLFTNISDLSVLKLSKNLLHGMVLSGNLSFGHFSSLALDNNCFTGKIGNWTSKDSYLETMDISNNFFTGRIPHWISNMSQEFELVARNNSLEGPFPCGKTPFSFLDISQNSFSGPIPSCLNFQEMKHLHLGSNKFTGSIPNVFRSLPRVLTLDIGNNSLSGRIPKFLVNLSDLRILILRENNFSGSIPKQLCQLSDVSLIDLAGNSISGSIPSCLQNVISPIKPVFRELTISIYETSSRYHQSVLFKEYNSLLWLEILGMQDEVQFTIKTHYRSYKGHILDLMVGLDLSCNKLVGEIPKELGLLTQIHSLNLSHNQLTGTIPMQFSNLENIESLDLSYNGLSGKVPSELIKLNSLAYFNVSYNNLSGKLPDMKAQFSTFTSESYEGNPLLCGPPLEKKCTSTSQVTDASGEEGIDKWYEIDMVSFYGSSGATWVVFLLGFVGVLYINPYWRRRWLDLIEECMYTFYYFLDDLVRKLSTLFRK
ncbi:Leucine-rich repeat-containing protein [Cynara cardunculus var. scolymus]|uniref:Leucine-rich repeat-containing protein n=1 Tax=Cynara cardunculus var. scolymus TaxID=59895 RepID=A0A118JJB1_CYNCS|nr:Leucine-rich repeat-containing protein [Cynara cardunculus var. scolymus]